MAKKLQVQVRKAAKDLPSRFKEVAEKLRHPIIIATKGHPCTGRRLVAFSLAAALRCPLIKEDDILRHTSSTKQSPPPTLPPKSGPIEELNQLICRFAASQLELGLSVVIDSELYTQSQFNQLKNLVESTKTRLVIIECQARDESELWRSLEQVEDVAFATRWWGDKPSSLEDLRRKLDEFNTHSNYDVADIPKFAADITPADDINKCVSYVLQSIATHVGSRQAQNEMCGSHLFAVWARNGNNQTSCDECLQQISGPIYKCDGCNFIFHKSCTRLPSTMKFTYRAPFTLSLRDEEDLEREERCNCCNKILEGCFYVVDTPRNRFYDITYIDLDCIFLPFTRRVKLHEHELVLCFDLQDFECDACGFLSKKSVYYTCPQFCGVKIDPNCAWLPETAVYERHRHPFKLSLSPRDDDSNQYYCNACENERDPKHWIYYCTDCDFPAHTRCLVPSALPPSECDDE